MRGRQLVTANLCGLVLAACGCGGKTEPAGPPAAGTQPAAAAPASDQVGSGSQGATRTRRRGPVQLGGPTPTGDSGDGQGSRQANHPGGLDVVMARMKPLQILLGRWQGVTNKQQVTVPQRWVWDLKSNPDQPALVLTSSESPFFRTGRLTWSAGDDAFEFTGTNREGSRQVFRGRFSQPPRTVSGDNGDVPQLTFKLELTEVVDASRKTSWRVVFNQQENNRLLVELSKRRGQAAFRREDTIGCQREGTRFAKSDSDYGEKTFEEEPEKWIARFEAMKKKKKSKL